MVEVNSDALIGQPVSAVARQLRQFGLRVRVLWEPRHQEPGTVMSVQPSGRMPAGSAVVITGALPEHYKPRPSEPAKPGKGPGKKRKHKQ